MVGVAPAKTQMAPKTATVHLSVDDANTLALFLSRIGWVEVRGKTHSDSEADATRAAVDRLQRALYDASASCDRILAIDEGTKA